MEYYVHSRSANIIKQYNGKIQIKKELGVDVKKKLLKKTFNKICKFQEKKLQRSTDQTKCY